MITKNKHSPATLYLLNTKNNTKIQDEKKSARLTFNKKKSSRSISQYQKWNISKDPTNNAPFQPSSRTNSQIKRIVLNKNQFGLQSLSVQRKLSSILQIFTNRGNKNYNNNKRVFTQADQKINNNLVRKSYQKNSGQYSLLSVKDASQRQKSHHSKQRKISHMRTQSMLNHSDYENSIQSISSRIQQKFKQYQKVIYEWRLRYNTQQNDYLLDQIIRGFKGIINQIIQQYSNQIVSNLCYFEQSLKSVSKQYEIQIASLNQQLNKNDNSKNIISSLLKQLNQKHTKGIICSKVFENMQQNGLNIQQIIKNSKIYQQIISIDQQKNNFNPEEILSLLPNRCKSSKCQSNVQGELKTQNIPKIMKKNTQYKTNYGDFIMKKTLQSQMEENQDSYDQQKLDCVQNSSPANWNQNFQNRQSIKGVLKYIHNHNKNNHSNSSEAQVSSISETGKVKKINKEKSESQTKNLKSNMKIDNWKSFQNKDRMTNNLIAPYKNIMSQR